MKTDEILILLETIVEELKINNKLLIETLYNPGEDYGDLYQGQEGRDEEAREETPGPESILGGVPG